MGASEAIAAAAARKAAEEARLALMKGPKGDPGADSIVPGPPGPPSTVPGPPGNDSVVPGPPGNPGAPGTTDYNALANKPTLGSAAATVTAPAQSSVASVVGADFARPADGLYVLAVVTTAAPATSSHVHVSAQLQLHNA